MRNFENMLAHGDEYNIMEKRVLPLLKHRYNRDTDEYRLEMLIDKFKNAQCAEKRDKIFGFLGIANDVGDDEIEVDYEVGLFELYQKLVDFHQKGAPIWEGHFRVFGEDIKEEFDRAVRLMKFSRLVQKMFEGAIGAEAESSKRSLKENGNENGKREGHGKEEEEERKFYYARGALAGEILYLGPTYSNTISSHKANKRWKSEIEKIYASMTSEAIKDLRTDDLDYSKIILDWDEEHLKRIRKVESKTSFGFRWSADDDDVLPDGLSELTLEETNVPGNHEAEVNEPRRFLATNSRIGFVPPEARVGDLVYQFRECDVAVILRNIGDEINDRWMIIRKAELSQRELREEWS